MPRPKVVGITGIIGSGKSTVGNIIASCGFFVIDTDEVVHRLLAGDANVIRAVESRFGSQVFDNRGAIDRAKLGAIVFDDENARKDLEAILHPAVLEECERLITEHSNEKVIFVLVPLLFEAKLEARYDQIWTVITGKPTLKERLKARSGFTDEDIEKRISAQMPQSEKAARSHVVIDNSGEKIETQLQVQELLKRF
jgi:dephospho-CoA kinase